MKQLNLTEQGKIFSIKGIALSSHLKEKRVGQRMAGECQRVLSSYGYKAEIENIEDESPLREGAALVIYAEMSRVAG
jgi:RNA 3'-terminal phosphate cyclase